MYTVNNKTFQSYLKAVAEANKTSSKVVETATGIIRWESAPKISNSKMIEYKGRLNAYNAMVNQ
jgi:hypothetical protein